jgi:hypothetical protein
MKNILIAAALCGLMVVSCGTKQEAQETTDVAPGQSAFDVISAVELDGTTVSVAGVTFTPPSGWTDLGPSGMRKADYALGPVEGEDDAASVAVYFFGTDQGGTVENNISRWVSQVGQASPDQPNVPVMNSLTVGDMKITTVEVTGTYQGSMGGGMGGQTAQPNYKLAGAVVEGPQGNVFFKLTGPKQGATAMIEGFVAMIHGLSQATGSPQ